MVVSGRAGGAGPHRPDRDARAAEAVGDPARQRAAGRAAADGEKRGERSGRLRRRHPGRGEARRGEHGDPRPHRVELPHVSEIAERRQPRAAALRGSGAIACGSKGDGAATYGPSRTTTSDQQAAGEGEGRGEQHRLAPRAAVERRQQVRKRLAERQARRSGCRARSRAARETSRRRASSPADRRTPAPCRSGSAGRSPPSPVGATSTAALAAAPATAPSSISDARVAARRRG